MSVTHKRDENTFKMMKPIRKHDAGTETHHSLQADKSRELLQDRQRNNTAWT